MFHCEVRKRQRFFFLVHWENFIASQMIFKGQLQKETDKMVVMSLQICICICVYKLCDKCVRRKRVHRITNQEVRFICSVLSNTGGKNVIIVTCFDYFKKANMNCTTES